MGAGVCLSSPSLPPGDARSALLELNLIVCVRPSLFLQLLPGSVSLRENMKHSQDNGVCVCVRACVRAFE